MSEQNEVVKRDQEASARESGESVTVLRPAVDIYEDAHGITLYADLPGVSKDRLELHIDRDSLTIQGEAQIATPEGLQPLYADVKSTRYERSFTLSSELDGEKADASLSNGTLQLHIPKRDEVRPRRIDVKVG